MPRALMLGLMAEGRRPVSVGDRWTERGAVAVRARARGAAGSARLGAAVGWMHVATSLAEQRRVECDARVRGACPVWMCVCDCVCCDLELELVDP